MMIEIQTNSIRAQILQALGEQCQNLLALLPDNSETEAQIYFARHNLKRNEVPAVVITPELETAERSYGIDVITMAVRVSMVCLRGEHEAFDLAENHLAQMRFCVGADDTLNGLAQDVRYIEGGVDEYPEQHDQALVVSTTWEIEYSTAADNPEVAA